MVELFPSIFYRNELPSDGEDERTSSESHTASDGRVPAVASLENFGKYMYVY